MRKTRLLAEILCLGLLCSLFTGCGSKNDTSTVEQTAEVTAEVSANVYSYLDYAEEDGDNLNLTVIAEPIGAYFSEGFDGSMISFDEDLKEAKDIQVTSVNADKTKAEITLSIPKKNLDAENLELSSQITLAADSLVDSEGDAISKEVCNSGIYVTEETSKGVYEGNVAIKELSYGIHYLWMEGDVVESSIADYWHKNAGALDKNGGYLLMDMTYCDSVGRQALLECFMFANNGMNPTSEGGARNVIIVNPSETVLDTIKKYFASHKKGAFSANDVLIISLYGLVDGETCDLEQDYESFYGDKNVFSPDYEKELEAAGALKVLYGKIMDRTLEKDKK